MRPPIRTANDQRCYDDPAGHWWRPGGPFEPLYWLAEARARLVPPADRPGALLVDVGCGAGLLAPYVKDKGYRHTGIDLAASALEQAAEKGVTPVRGNAIALPLRDGCADVVTAGELLEHIYNLSAAVRELCRVLRPGGLLLLDTLNATTLSKLVAVRLAESTGAVPRGIHDPMLLVPPSLLVGECASHGVKLEIRGIRPSVPSLYRWLVRGESAARRGSHPARGARIVPAFSAAVLYQARGVKTGGGLDGRG